MLGVICASFCVLWCDYIVCSLLIAYLGRFVVFGVVKKSARVLRTDYVGEFVSGGSVFDLC